MTSLSPVRLFSEVLSRPETTNQRINRRGSTLNYSTVSYLSSSTSLGTHSVRGRRRLEFVLDVFGRTNHTATLEITTVHDVFVCRKVICIAVVVSSEWSERARSRGRVENHARSSSIIYSLCVILF